MLQARARGQRPAEDADLVAGHRGQPGPPPAAHRPAREQRGSRPGQRREQPGTLGAEGGILASAHLCTAGFAALIAAWRDGRAGPARALGHRLAGLSAALFAEPNPTVIKGVLHAQGLIPSPAVRLPLLPARPATVRAALRLTRPADLPTPA